MEVRPSAATAAARKPKLCAGPDELILSNGNAAVPHMPIKAVMRAAVIKDYVVGGCAGATRLLVKFAVMPVDNRPVESRENRNADILLAKTPQIHVVALMSVICPVRAVPVPNARGGVEIHVIVHEQVTVKRASLGEKRIWRRIGSERLWLVPPFADYLFDPHSLGCADIILGDRKSVV